MEEIWFYTSLVHMRVVQNIKNHDNFFSFYYSTNSLCKYE